MPCYRPLKGYRSQTVNPATGKRSIVFSAREGYGDMLIQLPCGQCLGCRLEQSRQWAVRATHEASLYDQNCFVTLTYADEHLPRFGYLDYQAPVKWLKRLRERFSSRTIRSFGCAEYGEKFGRPHYHVCLFNFDFPDRVRFARAGENFVYTSKIGDELWPFGHCVIGDLSFESAAYVARYCTKKVLADGARPRFAVVDEVTGEVFERPDERSVCVSRRPGLGKPWLDRFHSDVFSFDHVVVRGKAMLPPKYYDRRCELDFPADWKRIRAARSWDARFEVPLTDSERRLDVEESCAELRFAQLKRHYEGDENA